MLRWSLLIIKIFPSDQEMYNSPTEAHFHSPWGRAIAQRRVSRGMVIFHVLSFPFCIIVVQKIFPVCLLAITLLGTCRRSRTNYDRDSINWPRTVAQRTVSPEFLSFSSYWDPKICDSVYLIILSNTHITLSQTF